MLASHLHLIRSNASRLSLLTSRRLYSAIKSRHNQAIVDLLLKCREEEERKPDSNSFKVYAFTHAIDSVLSVDRPIRSGNDVHALRGIGPGILTRINDYLYKLYADDATRDQDTYREIMKVRATTILNSIPAIGRKRAIELVDAGCLSLDDLISGKFNSMLTPKQILNVKYLTHIEQPVLSQDAEDVLAFCRESLDARYEMVLVGDYRRGIDNFPDIQVMILHPDFVHVPLPTEPPPGSPSPQKDAAPKPRKRRKNRDDEERTNLLHGDVVPLLQERGLISDTFTSDFTSWQGIIRLPGRHREWGARPDRISAIKNMDGHFRKMSLHIVPQKSLGSALLSLTGDSEFDKELCNRAQRQGMLFNEYGLWKWNPGQNNPMTSVPDEAQAESIAQSDGYWSLVNSTSEEDIFRELDIKFVDPTKRNFLFLFGKARKRRTVQP
ncbi:hypothetical protein BDZ97DRAFT_1903577 [Flammula alnicola]|nr:hypothetical protein BDZ97DRAFT_1903577 [Flammula alnicola]